MNMRSFAVAVLLAVAAAHPASSQGPLTPPGPPAPTMKSLDQLDGKLDQQSGKLDQHSGKLDQANAKLDAVDAKAEKRTPIDATRTPGDDDSEFIINQPGSYYLVANLSVGKPMV